MAYRDTLATTGQGTGIVVSTWRNTEIAHIRSLPPVSSRYRLLLLIMREFGRWLMLGILLTAIVTFVFGVWIRNHALADMFLVVVALSVAARH